MSHTVRQSRLKLAVVASASMLAFSAHAQTTTPAPPSGNVVRPMYGNIQPFYGNIQPFYGNIQPFYGNLNPFYGNLQPFWGNIQPFWGNIQPFYGNLQPFWGNIQPFTGANGAPTSAGLQTYWTGASSTWTSVSGAWSSSDYAGAASKLQTLINDSATVWGPSVQAGTGKSFQEGFVAPLLARYGINLNDSSSLSALTESQRAMFFLEWYDGLMEFSGSDHVDHWMGAVNWSPNLTQVQGGGGRTVIGLLDFSIDASAGAQARITSYSGASTFSNGHGAAVASLLIGAHDGRGTMGIAPSATVLAYNPFDSTGTASWADIIKGVETLTQNGASVINMSLGVPGLTLDQGWNEVFSTASIAEAAKKTVFVIAAGNEGVSQTQNLNWNFSTNPNIIIVGSVDLAGNISSFSNRPGTACLLNAGVCSVGNRLMDRFIVAPGELILVSDGKGGVTRMSGTSFAAPLVSGAIALLHDRWPWLANYPDLTSKIILTSARDLGAPGTDPVYGRGMLDIKAALSPLDFDKVRWLYADASGAIQEQTASVVATTINTTSQSTFDTKGIFYYAFERLTSTNRDYAIPLSTRLVGQTVTSRTGSQEQFQAFLTAQLAAWAAAKAAAPKFVGTSFDFADSGVPVGGAWGMDMRLSISPRSTPYGFRQDGPLYQSRLRMAGERFRADLGFGDGAPVMNGVPGLGLASDYDSDRGGVNPILGLASGGGYANMSFDLTDRLSLSAGATQRIAKRDARALPGVDRGDNGAEIFQASASQFGLTYRVTDGAYLVGSYTRLREASSLLGVQSFDPHDFTGGSTTDAYTVGLGLSLSRDLTLAGSATMANTRQSEGGQSIGVAPGGLTSSAYQVSLTKANLLARGDVARFSLSQPLVVEDGKFDVTTVQVVDRETGEIGIVTQSFDVSQARPYAAELLYGRSVFDGQADLSFFGRVDVKPGSEGEQESYMAGARIRIGF